MGCNEKSVQSIAFHFDRIHAMAKHGNIMAGPEITQYAGSAIYIQLRLGTQATYGKGHPPERERRGGRGGRQ